ncbi:glycosyltransferase family 4 protein [Pedococcus sp. 2YAF34]|uniref:glycosyltransferase family 4 protein n=1 Tax=Pedococcus sp. 2YAF34 TaxID=3233032 RepID=UPI003F99CE80
MRRAGERPAGVGRGAHVVLVVENVSLAHDHRLRKQAASLAAAGYEVTVICRRDPGNRRLPGVRVLDYPAPRDADGRLAFVWEYAYSWVMAAVLMWRSWLIRPFALIQISGMPDVYAPLAVPFRWMGAVIVLDQRDLAPEVYLARFGGRGGLVHRILLACERTSFRTADHVVTVNESCRAVVRDRGGLPEERITVVGNGPHLARVRPAPRDRHTDIVPAGGVVCWVGVMGPQDSVELALRAAAHLVHDCGRTRLEAVLIGDGDQRPSLQRLADDLGIAANVRFTGWLDEEDVFAQLAAADVGLEPNLEAVVSPVKVMEYMACGLPFVAFDLPQTRSLGGAGGLYAEPGDVPAFADAVRRLLEDADLRAASGDQGRRRVLDTVAWEHQEAVYLELFAYLLPARELERSL